MNSRPARRAVESSRHEAMRCVFGAIILIIASPGVVLADEDQKAKEAPVAPLVEPIATTLDSAADLRRLEARVREIYGKVKQSVVQFSGGSGVVVSADGYVLTVAHVGREAGRTVTLTFPDGRRVRAKTLGNDSGLDAGLAKITDEGEWPHVEMGVSDAVDRGAWCLAISYPGLFRRAGVPTVRLGRVQRRTGSSIVTDCTIMGGDSGGPLFDLEGKVIGISSRCDDNLNRNIHVPVDVYRGSWDKLTAGEDFNSRRVDRAFLGVAPAPDTDTPRIGRVVEDSAAKKAGLQAGDVVLKFNGEPLKTYDELRALVQKKKPGEEVTLEVRRGQETLTLKAKLERR